MQNHQELVQNLANAQNALALYNEANAVDVIEIEDLEIPHHIYPGFSLEFSLNPHVDRYEEACPICIVKFNHYEILYLTPCLHIFHTECFTNNVFWNGLVCPMCRYNI
jgi:hypothetical protein